MEAILVGILSALSALAGTLITQFYESRRRLSEENRWYAEFFLGRKVDALQNLYAALVDCYYTLNFYGNVPPKTLIEHREKVIDLFKNKKIWQVNLHPAFTGWILDILNP